VKSAPDFQKLLILKNEKHNDEYDETDQAGDKPLREDAQALVSGNIPAKIRSER